MNLLAICTDTNGHFYSQIIVPMFTTAVALTVFLLAVIYMAAHFFKKSEYESYVSIEMGQLAFTILIFLTLIGTACFSAELSEEFAGGDPYDIAREYLAYMSNQVAVKEVQWLYFSLLNSQYWGSWTEKRGCSPWGVIMTTFPSFILIERITEFLLLIISPFAASLLVQSAIIEIIRGTMLPFVLPVGIVLRLIPQTRDASAFLIATAIGFGIIFPFTYVMHSKIVEPLIESSFKKTKLTQSTDLSIIRDRLKADGSGFYAIEFDKAYKLKPGEQTVIEDVNNIKYIIEYNNYVYTVYYRESVEDRLIKAGKIDFAKIISESGKMDLESTIFSPFRTLSFILLQALFLPALSITLTIAFIKGFTKFISQKMG